MVSPAIGYAAGAMGHLAWSGDGPVRVQELARAIGAPPAYLSKIVHRLARKGLLDTARGRGGGVVLAADPATITLYDLCEALDDSILHPTCALGVTECSDERACPAHELQRDVRARQLAFLKATTVKQIGEFEQAKRAAAKSASRTGKTPAGGARSGRTRL